LKDYEQALSNLDIFESGLSVTLVGMRCLIKAFANGVAYPLCRVETFHLAIISM
jgi:hypothetical protein